MSATVHRNSSTAPGRPRVRRGPVLVAVALAVAIGLSACSGPTTVTVNGTVVDLALTPLGIAFPGASATVAIDGTDVPVATDGTFTVTGVHMPYDVVVGIPTFNFVMVYEGLTRADPTLTVPELGTPFTTTVAGSIGTTLGANEMGLVLPGGDAFATGTTMLTSGSGPAFGPTSVAWGGSATRTTTLYALTAHVPTGGGAPTSFTGYGSTAVTLTDGVATSGVSINLGGVTTATMDGSVTLPVGYSLDGAGVVLRLGAPTGALLGIAPSVASTSFTGVHVPEHSGIRYGIAASASDATGRVTRAWRDTPGPGTTATIALPAPVVPTAPKPNATQVGPGATFSWTGLPSAVYLAILEPPSTSDPTVYVFSDQTSVPLPDTSAVGMPLTAGTTYGYRVQAIGPMASIDELAQPGGMNDWIQLQTLFLSGSGTVPSSIGPTDAPGAGIYWTQSDPRTFTAGP